MNETNQAAEMQIFKNPDFGEIRTVTINGEPWLVGKDVAAALGYSNTKDALAKHVDDEDKQIIQRSENATFDIPNRGLTIINESGLYSLILSSKLPGAKKFKRWVTSEVLPTLRRTGSYTIPDAPYASAYELRPMTPSDYLNAARIIAGCRDERLPLVVPLIRAAGIDVPNVEIPRYEVPSFTALKKCPYRPEPQQRYDPFPSAYTEEEREAMRISVLALYPSLADEAE